MAKKTTTKDEAKQGVEITVSSAKLTLELEPALRALGNFTDIENMDVMLDIARTKTNVDNELEIFMKTRKSVVEGAAEQGEDGRPKTKTKTVRDQFTGAPTESQVYIFPDKETEQKANWKLQELDEKKIKVTIYPIPYTEIKECEGLTANIIKAAGVFITV